MNPGARITAAAGADPSLATLAPGWADPVADAQQVFRLLLTALSLPTRVQALPPRLADTLQPPAPLGRAQAALLLALLDGETTLWLSPRLDRPACRTWLGFHTGVRRAAQPAQADFLAADAADLDEALWQALPRGDALQPERGATLLLALPQPPAQALAAPALAAHGAGTPASAAAAAATSPWLSGPGLPQPARLQAAGLPAGFWDWRRADQALLPRGVDLVFTAGDRLAALPRSTRIAPQG